MHSLEHHFIRRTNKCLCIFISTEATLIQKGSALIYKINSFLKMTLQWKALEIEIHYAALSLLRLR